MTDIVDRLRRWTHDPQVPPASDLMDEAADEIVRLRGELVLWKAAAKLTRDERQVLEQSIASATLVGTEDQVRRLRWLLERLTFPVPETMPKEKRAEVSYRKTDEKRGDGHTSRATLTDEEREAIAWAARLAQSQRDSRDMAGDYAASMRGLLERMAAANSGEDRRSGGGE
jgi:hypothetical protein